MTAYKRHTPNMPFARLAWFGCFPTIGDGIRYIRENHGHCCHLEASTHQPPQPTKAHKPPLVLM